MITYTPDAAGRDVSAIDSSGATPINYVTGAVFEADNGITGFVNGSASGFAGIANSFSYNKRLQPLSMSASSPSQTVFSVGYDFHLGNGDNGNVFAITNNRDHSRDQTFTYDQLNRLTSAQNAGTSCSQMTANNKNEYWGNSYGYDAWGNLLSKTVTKCGAENLSVSVTANNQLLGGYTYDIAGNMLHDATANLNYTYDQESRISTAGGTTYTYDAGGNRVKKSNGSTGTIYWYSAVGVIAESDLSGNMQHEYVFFGGRRVARKDLPGNAVSYYFSDHLQRASVITDSAGNIKADSDYYPFGGELQIVNNNSNDYKFTGKKRDTETGLDYFGARYYSNAFGRFVTPDWSGGPTTVPYAHLDNPQTLNLYSYVDNNPINGIDADGHARESMVDDAGSWGPNMFIGGPVIETDWSGTLDTTTNILTITSVQTSLVTQDLSQTLNGTTSETALPGGSSAQYQPAEPGEQHHGEPARLVQYGVDPITSHDTQAGPLKDTCESCYGAQTFAHYYIADEAGHSLLGGQFTVTEHIRVLDKTKTAKIEQSWNVPSNGLLKDKIGAHSDKPIKSIHLKSEQTFTVDYKGKSYFLRTRINQVVDKTKTGWVIRADVIVP